MKLNGCKCVLHKSLGFFTVVTINHVLFTNAIYYMHLIIRKYGWNPLASFSCKVPWKEKRQPL
jgi:hypothetical protein